MQLLSDFDQLIFSLFGVISLEQQLFLHSKGVHSNGFILFHGLDVGVNCLVKNIHERPDFGQPQCVVGKQLLDLLYDGAVAISIRGEWGRRYLEVDFGINEVPERRYGDMDIVLGTKELLH